MDALLAWIVVLQQVVVDDFSEPLVIQTNPFSSPDTNSQPPIAPPPPLPVAAPDTGASAGLAMSAVIGAECIFITARDCFSRSVMRMPQKFVLVLVEPEAGAVEEEDDIEAGLLFSGMTQALRMPLEQPLKKMVPVEPWHGAGMQRMAVMPR